MKSVYLNHLKILAENCYAFLPPHIKVLSCKEFLFHAYTISVYWKSFRNSMAYFVRGAGHSD